mmetsp:Transcript_82787/g.230855  ORF Transcript_82787/g.230855 Transcript_82787/m.230855 type:complete len:203 (-) Transcript_82787:17-625(-)
MSIQMPMFATRVTFPVTMSPTSSSEIFFLSPPARRAMALQCRHCTRAALERLGRRTEAAVAAPSTMVAAMAMAAPAVTLPPMESMPAPLATPCAAAVAYALPRSWPAPSKGGKGCDKQGAPMLMAAAQTTSNAAAARNAAERRRGQTIAKHIGAWGGVHLGCTVMATIFQIYGPRCRLAHAQQTQQRKLPGLERGSIELQCS